MSVFRAYDIRGIAGRELTPELAYLIGRAHVAFTGAHTVVVGKDMRLSSEDLKKGLCQGIIDQGANVVDIGLSSTPMLYFAVAYYGNPAGIMITASHNPAEYNGFKLTREHAIPIGADNGMADIERLVERREFGKQRFRGFIMRKDITADYRRHVLAGADVPKLRVVADAANAMGCLEVEHLKQVPNLEVIPLNCELDGTFPSHEANPLKEENMRQLQEAVVREKADIGIAFDGDADRIGFVDERGEIVPADFVAALIAGKLLSTHPGAKVLYDLRASWALPEKIREHGGKALMCRVGHAFIKQQMRKEDALFAGELSCHYYFRDHYFTESSLMAALHVFSLMKDRKKSELVKPLKKYHHSGEINSTVSDPDAVLAGLQELHSGALNISHLDGLRIEYPSHWFNVRKSNTEPLVRLNVEARTREEMERVRDGLLAYIRGH